MFQKLCFFSAIILLFCLNPYCSRTALPELSGVWTRENVVSSGPETFFVPLHIYHPRVASISGGYPLLIALHGWNERGTDWQKSGIESLADRYGILVVCPEMGKANYEREYFPETTLRWNAKPSGVWIKEILYKYITSRFPISEKRQKRGLIGVSTGGHGALLVAGYYPDLFGFAGMISGDFDVSKTPDDPLAAGSFGPFQSFPERWRNGSAVALLNSFADTRIFVAHGSEDTVAPVSQSRLFSAVFQGLSEKNKGKYLFEYTETPGAGHGWPYWKTQLEGAVRFFANGF